MLISTVGCAQRRSSHDWILPACRLHLLKGLKAVGWLLGLELQSITCVIILLRLGWLKWLTPRGYFPCFDHVFKLFICEIFWVDWQACDPLLTFITIHICFNGGCRGHLCILMKGKLWHFTHCSLLLFVVLLVRCVSPWVIFWRHCCPTLWSWRWRIKPVRSLSQRVLPSQHVCCHGGHRRCLLCLLANVWVLGLDALDFVFYCIESLASSQWLNL